jgi:ElaB/YqjD/DUF883 family membrane-anchored ribosome-binding protein
MENEEVIRLRMEETREALTDKLECLEQHVSDSVTAVTDKVVDIKEKVQEGVESVKDAVDVPAHVENHPWLMLGGSVACGFLLGNLLMGTKKTAPATYMALPTRAPERTNGNGRQAPERQESLAADRSWLSAFEPEIRHLKGLALGVTLGTVRELLAEQVPPHMAEQVREIVDAVTKKAGGDPVPSSDWAAIKPARSPAAGPECSEANAQNSRW